MTTGFLDRNIDDEILIHGTEVLNSDKHISKWTALCFYFHLVDSFVSFFLKGASINKPGLRLYRKQTFLQV